MGAGDFICISMTGGAPWGFRLQGGQEQQQPLQVAKIRSQSKASGSGLCEGDEVVSINGQPCAGLTYPQVIELMAGVTDSLCMLVRRPAGGISDTLLSETENRAPQRAPHEGCLESTTLQIRPAPRSQGPELPLAFIKEETGLSCPGAPHSPDTPGGCPAGTPVVLRERGGPVLELQLSLSQEAHTGPRAPVVTLLGAEKPECPDLGPDLDGGGTAHTEPVPTRGKGGPSLRSSKTIQIRSSSPELGARQGREAGGARLPRVEVILGCADQTPGLRLPAAAGGVDSPVEGGQSEAPPSVVAFAVSSEGTELGEEPCTDRDPSRPHKHRARHARLRRSESLSEKQVKEAKSRCRSIALLLTAAPSPHSRGVRMFKRRRRRARKFTLISYGTGELRRPQEDSGDPEDGDSDSPFEGALLGASESDADEEPPSDTDDSAQDWDSGLGDVEKKLPRGDRMEMLPDTSGKGALMFARRRERMDQIAAQQEDAAAHAHGPRAGPPHGETQAAAGPGRSCVTTSYLEVSPGASLAPPHDGFSAAPYPAEAPRMVPVNRTARPFPGSGAQPAPTFSAPRGMMSPTADFPAPPPYSAVTPPPGSPARAATSPVAGPAQPPPWPEPAPWCPERMASRDERIAVPAKRTGILQEAKRRSTAKPMFTFKEPKVSPNPELLSLLQHSDGKRGGGAGGDSGPEEDHLSLGAEACNFMRSPSAKQKTPPPVAPKPAAKSSSSQPGTPVTPVSPVWSPGATPAFPASAAALSQGPGVAPGKMAQPAYAPARPASALSLAGPFRGPPAAAASVNYAASTARAAPTPAAGAAGPPGELPSGMQGRGAQLFARRQSRMEKYVVDSDTVQAHAARAQSPTPSLPAAWKYSPNVRAPPPVAYNPIHSPSYPLAAIKSQPSTPQASRTGRKKGKKPLNALDVMKHQPYQLSTSLFTFQPPEAKAGLPQRLPTKVSAAPAVKQAPPPAVNASTPAGVLSFPPARSPVPAFFPEAASPVSASPVPEAVPGSPKQESASTPSFLAPRPKFSARKSGVALQESGRPRTLPGGRAPPTVSATPPWAHRPACGYPAERTERLEKATDRRTPWGAAAGSPRGLVGDAFEPGRIQESVAVTVVSAARRKVLSGAPEDGSRTPSWAPGALGTIVGPAGGWESGLTTPPSSGGPPTSRDGAPWPDVWYRRPSRPEPDTLSLDGRFDGCFPVAGGNYNPKPRGWRRQT